MEKRNWASLLSASVVSVLYTTCLFSALEGRESLHSVIINPRAENEGGETCDCIAEGRPLGREENAKEERGGSADGQKFDCSGQVGENYQAYRSRREGGPTLKFSLSQLNDGGKVSWGEGGRGTVPEESSETKLECVIPRVTEDEFEGRKVALGTSVLSTGGRGKVWLQKGNASLLERCSSRICHPEQ